MLYHIIMIIIVERDIIFLACVQIHLGDGEVEVFNGETRAYTLFDISNTRHQICVCVCMRVSVCVNVCVCAVGCAIESFLRAVIRRIESSGARVHE